MSENSLPFPETLHNFFADVGIVNLPSVGGLNQDENYQDTGRYNSERYELRRNESERNDDEEEIFESSFDLSEERLKHFFHMFDTDDDGKISYESLKKGLQYHVDDFDNKSFDILIKHLDIDKSGDISFEEFAEGIRLMLLRTLVKVRGPSARMQIIDYDANRLELKTSNELTMSSPEVLTELYFHSMPSWVNVRWVNVLPSSHSSLALTMKKLAVKFALHPLSLEDALTISSQRPKVEAFSNHYLIMVPILSVDKPQLVEEVVAVKPGNNVVSSCCEFLKRCTPYGKKNEATIYHPAKASNVRVTLASIFVLVPTNNTVITLNEPKKPDPWVRVHRELEKRYSKLRQYDAQYLTYALLDHAVDLLHPVVKQLRKDLELEAVYLQRVRFRDDLNTMHAIRREMEKVVRKLRPFIRLLVHVIEDDAISPGATLYLKDVLDNLENEEEELKDMIAECYILDSEADKAQSRQMDQTLYTLTVISSVFLPAQFLSGVWGMNFVNMPELDKPWGYPMFWALTSLVSIILLLLLNFGRLHRY